VWRHCARSRIRSSKAKAKQFDSSSTPKPLGRPPDQHLRYTLTRDLTHATTETRLGKPNHQRNDTIRFVEVIDGDIGALLESETKDGSKPGSIRPAGNRMREEKRVPIKLLLATSAEKNLKRLADADVNGIMHAVVSFIDGGDEFHIYLDPKTHLPVQVDILEDDPLEGDSSYLLRYGDWRKIDDVMMPFSLRYELNGNVLQEEQIKSIQNNVTFVADPFAIPESVRAQKSDTAPIASQWILRRVAGNVSYQDFGRPPKVNGSSSPMAYTRSPAAPTPASSSRWPIIWWRLKDRSTRRARRRSSNRLERNFPTN